MSPREIGRITITHNLRALKETGNNYEEAAAWLLGDRGMDEV